MEEIRNWSSTDKHTADIVMESIIMGARERLGNDPANQQEAMAKPFKFFTLTNELSEQEGEVANFYVFQKVFKGEFQVNIAMRMGIEEDFSNKSD